MKVHLYNLVVTRLYNVSVQARDGTAVQLYLYSLEVTHFYYANAKFILKFSGFSVASCMNELNCTHCVAIYRPY